MSSGVVQEGASRPRPPTEIIRLITSREREPQGEKIIYLAAEEKKKIEILQEKRGKTKVRCRSLFPLDVYKSRGKPKKTKKRKKGEGKSHGRRCWYIVSKKGLH